MRRYRRVWAPEAGPVPTIRVRQRRDAALVSFLRARPGVPARGVRHKHRPVRLRIHQYDDIEDDTPHVEIFVEDNGYAARQDTYASRDEFAAFGRSLQMFPQTVKQEVVFESGSPSPKWACHILLRAYVADRSGHTSLEVRISNNLSGQHHASAHFHILCEAAALNRLGQSLESWAHSGRREFEYSHENGEPAACTEPGDCAPGAY